MAETIRALSALLTLSPTGTVGGISAQDFRDLAHSSMGGIVPYVAKSGAYTLTDDDCYVTVDASGASRTMTLPAGASTRAGKFFIVQKIDSSGNSVVVARAGSDTISGATSKSTTTQYNAIIVISTGTAAWYAFGLSVAA